MLKSEILANLPKWHKRANELLKGDSKKERPALVIPPKATKKDLVDLAKPLLAVLKKYGEEKVRIKPGSDDDIVEVKKTDPGKTDPGKTDPGKTDPKSKEKTKPAPAPKAKDGKDGKDGKPGKDGADGKDASGSRRDTPLWVICAVVGALLLAMLVVGTLISGAGLIGIGAAVSDSGSGGSTPSVVVVPDSKPNIVVVDTGPSREWKAWAQAHDGNARYFFSGD